MTNKNEFSTLLDLQENCGKKHVKATKEAEDKGSDEAYQAFFQKMLKKFGVKNPDELDDKKKKEFYKAVDDGWNADHEAGDDGVTEADHEMADDSEKDEKSEKDDKKKDTGSQEAYKKFFKKMLAKYGVKEPDELDDDKKKKFYNEVDKKWNADHEAGKDGKVEESLSLASILTEAHPEEEKTKKKDEPQKLVKKKAPEKKEGDKEADIKIDDREEEPEEEELTIEFPEGVYLELEFEGDVNGDQVKLKAQKLYQAGSNPVEVALEIAKEFNALDWTIADISTMGDDDDEEGAEDNEKAVDESALTGKLSALLLVEALSKEEKKAAQAEKVVFSKELRKQITKELGFKVTSTVIKSARADSFIQINGAEAFSDDFQEKVAKVAGMSSNIQPTHMAVLISKWKELGY